MFLVCFAALAEVFLDFFLSLFESLRVQLGATFTGDTVNMFLTLVGGNQLASVIMKDQNTGAEFTSKFISLLRIIVEEPGKSMDKFVPNVISLCIQQLCPLISSGSKAATHISPSFYDLVRSILLSQWKYFFPLSAVSAAAFQMDRQSPTQSASQTTGQLDEFRSLLEVCVQHTFHLVSWI